jgi:hypothetical protein
MDQKRPVSDSDLSEDIERVILKLEDHNRDVFKKLDQILNILNMQQIETYIPIKWKSVIDYCESEELKPERVLELLVVVVNIANKQNKKT